MRRFKTLERSPSLPAEIVTNLSNAIASGELRPGDQLPTEQVLASEFGVARTVVREAISRLRYDGVIQSRQGVGAFVAKPEERTAFRISPQCFGKRQALLKLLKLRTGLASEAAGEAAEMRTDDQLRRMRRCIDEMRAAVAGEDRADLRFEAESRLYRVIAEASGNEHIIAFIGMIDNQISENLQSVAVKNAKAAEWGDAVVDEHEVVVDAIGRRNGATARDGTRTHYERAAQRLAERADIADVRFRQRSRQRAWAR